ncbi:MAG: AraC family transcriptional regulator [Clostridiales bacterium]|nr:AraC family transcriptional regulator [Clostridiales bacterium]
MDAYERTVLNKAFDVSSVITVHYFEHGRDYIFEGESHDFWEMVYADRGDVLAYFNDEWHTLKPGYAVFHKPMQFHNLKADGHTAPNVMIISFDCRSELMDFFEDKVLYIPQRVKDKIAEIIRFAGKAFTTRLDDPYTKKLIKSGDTAAEQYIQLYIEEMLLSLYMHYSTTEETEKNKLNSTVSIMNGVFDRATDYMRKNLNKSLTIENISNALHVSQSELKRVFREYTGMGVITYFRNMRIEHAKTLIRDGGQNITEISERMGYESIHCFSKQFKSVAGMSPREYSLSIKMWLDADI